MNGYSGGSRNGDGSPYHGAHGSHSQQPHFSPHHTSAPDFYESAYVNELDETAARTFYYPPGYSRGNAVSYAVPSSSSSSSRPSRHRHGHRHYRHHRRVSDHNPDGIEILYSPARRSRTLDEDHNLAGRDLNDPRVSRRGQASFQAPFDAEYDDEKDPAYVTSTNRRRRSVNGRRSQDRDGHRDRRPSEPWLMSGALRPDQRDDDSTTTGSRTPRHVHWEESDESRDAKYREVRDQARRASSSARSAANNRPTVATEFSSSPTAINREGENYESELAESLQRSLLTYAEEQQRQQQQRQSRGHHRRDSPASSPASPTTAARLDLQPWYRVRGRGSSVDEALRESVARRVDEQNRRIEERGDGSGTAGVRPRRGGRVGLARGKEAATPQSPSASSSSSGKHSSSGDSTRSRVGRSTTRIRFPGDDDLDGPA